jgi:hypothetical protein
MATTTWAKSATPISAGTPAQPIRGAVRSTSYRTRFSVPAMTTR